MQYIKGVYTTSEILFEEQKLLIEKAFDCKTYNLYGCGEVLAIGCSCEHGNIHINPEMAIVEVEETDDNGNSALIVTGLMNRAMPFVRYKNGDSINLVDIECEYGRKTQIIDLEIARVADRFKFRNGKIYPSLYFILRFYKDGFEGVELFQFHQISMERIVLKILKNERFNTQTVEQLNNVIDEIETHIEKQAEVELKYVTIDEFRNSLKHFYAKSDVK